MAKKPDTPCAGGCGALLQSSATSLPAGERTCHPCRRAGRGPRRGRTRDCAVCGALFYPTDHRDRKQLTCSLRCGAAARQAAGRAGWNRAPHTCHGCGGTTTRHSRWCATCATARRSEYNQRKNLRRRAGGTRIMSIRELAERDRWRCHLCRRRVSRTLRYPHPRSASRDHLVPVADGGTNEPTNLALAHWDCNVRRRTGGNVQLQLVG